MSRSVLIALAAITTVIAVRQGTAQTPPAPTSVWSGVYSTEQAARGKKLYVRDCAKCHGESLLGGEGGPALAGKEFMLQYDKRSVGALFDVMQTTMPDENPGSLSTRQYADLVAFVLSENGFPAGKTDLSNVLAALTGIQIGPKP